jgi:hypothetical protein
MWREDGSFRKTGLWSDSSIPLNGPPRLSRKETNGRITSSSAASDASWFSFDKWFVAWREERRMEPPSAIQFWHLRQKIRVDTAVSVGVGILSGSGGNAKSTLCKISEEITEMWLWISDIVSIEKSTGNPLGILNPRQDNYQHKSWRRMNYVSRTGFVNFQDMSISR